MRTTLDIEDRILAKARKMAVRKKTTLTRVIEEALRQYLMPTPKAPPPIRSRWVVVEGKRPPSIDIADRDRLYDRMEGRLP